MLKKIYFKSLLLFIFIIPLSAYALMVGPTCPPFCSPPQDSEKYPVIILPGILGSWNLDLMISDILPNKWSFPPKVHTYNDLIQALENAGYEKDKDLFIGFYDWRQSNEESAQEYLIPVIDKAKQVSGKDKVDIIAHSMGGLVARSYIQSPDYRNDVNRLIMLGTPNIGSADAYLIWEGAQLPEDWSPIIKNIFNIYLDLVLVTYSQPGPLPIQYVTKTEIIQNQIPSLKELLPVYNFLIDKQTGNTIGYKFLSTVNTFLDNLNNTLPLLTSRTNVITISGNNIPTLEKIQVKSRSFLDELQKKWIDGKPDPNPPLKDTNQGDNRVILSSSQIDNAVRQIVLNQGKHDRLPTIAQREVVEILTGERPVAYFDTPDPESVISWTVASPADIEVITPNGDIINKNSQPSYSSYISETNPLGVKVIIIENPQKGDYQIKLTGIGDGGKYHLFTNFANEKTISLESESIIKGNILPNEKISYQTSLLLDNTQKDKVAVDTVKLTLQTLQKNLNKYWKKGKISKLSTYFKLKSILKHIETLEKVKEELEEKSQNMHPLAKSKLEKQIQKIDKSISKQYNKFIKEVERQRGKSIDEGAADLLTDQAEYLAQK